MTILRAATLLGLGVLAALFLVTPGALSGFDGQSMFGVTRSIVEHWDVTVHDAVIGVPGLGGRYYSKFGPGQSLLAIPLYLVGRALEAVVPSWYRPELPGLVSSLLPALAIAFTAALLVLAAVELGASLRGALLLGIVYAVASPAGVYATLWFSEPLTACATLAAVYLLLRDRDRLTLWRPLLAGVATALAVCTRLESLLFAPPLLLYAALPRRARLPRAAAFALPLAVALIGLALYNAARFGSPLETGYSEGLGSAMRDTHPPHTLASLAEGLYGLLISPGKGLLEYAPVLLLAPLGAAMLWRRRRRPELLLLLTVFALDLVAHANVLIRWVGGWSWGPRFLLPVLPLALLLLAPLLGEVLTHPSRKREPTPLSAAGEGEQSSGLRPPGWTGTGRSQLDRSRPVGSQSAKRGWSGASQHVLHGKRPRWTADPAGRGRGASQPSRWTADPAGRVGGASQPWTDRGRLDSQLPSFSGSVGPPKGRGRAPRGVLAALVVAGIVAQAPALVVYEPHTYIHYLQATVRVAGHPVDVTTLEDDYINRPTWSPIIGSWQQLGLAGTWTPPGQVSPELLTRQNVTVAPHTWWRLLSYQGVPTTPLAVVCALLLALAIACVYGAFRVAGRWQAMGR